MILAMSSQYFRTQFFSGHWSLQKHFCNPVVYVEGSKDDFKDTIATRRSRKQDKFKKRKSNLRPFIWPPAKPTRS